MSRKTAEKTNYSKKIVSLLADKPAISIAKLLESLASPSTPKATRGAVRSLKGLHEAGMVAYHDSGQQEYARLTTDGRRKAHAAKLDLGTTLVNPRWDGKWRIILLDIPENRKTERDGLRYLLKKAGFVCLKNSVWISMHPFEHMFMNIKHDLGLTSELMIFVTDKIDSATEETFLTLTSQHRSPASR